MNYVAMALLAGMSLQADFDLRIFSRDLKNDTPWSIEGAAQDLRSDVKHRIQVVMDQFILLLPEATWQDKEPSVEAMQKALNWLDSYNKQENRKDKIQQVKESLRYILREYVPKVQQSLLKAQTLAAEKQNEQQIEQKTSLMPRLLETLNKALEEVFV